MIVIAATCVGNTVHAQIKHNQLQTPLFVVDGIEWTGDSKNITISPDSIESITVLKDSKATAAYGEKGKNGVIVITTKRHQPEKVDAPLKGDTHLIVIDGVESDDLKNIPPESVETITVLKGPSAVALYGEKAQNGAIVITTKK